MCGTNIFSPYYVNKVMFLTCHNKMRMALFDLQSKIVGWKITQVSEMIEDIYIYINYSIYIYIKFCLRLMFPAAMLEYLSSFPCSIP